MHQQPPLSIIFSVCNGRNIIEDTLSCILEMENIPFELIIINDGSSDGSGEVIQSLLDHYQHEQSYYFDYDQPAGRARCLNEGIRQASGQVIWAPTSVQTIDEDQLKSTLAQLLESSSFFAITGDQFPSNPDAWKTILKNEKWPADGAFLWNREAIPSPHFFFSPFLNGGLALELSCRLSFFSTPKLIKPFFSCPEEDAVHRPTDNERVELTYNMLRRGQPNDKQQDWFKFLDQLSNQSATSSGRQSHKQLLQQALHMKKDGRLGSALELLEHVLDDNPDHEKARQLKIEILEKKRRFVQASELKHSANEPKKQTTQEQEITTSIIIPTTLYGKPALEQCLISIDEHCSSEGRELIIIDNASLDDTHDYLGELQEKNFFNCTVITNEQNKGFAASVNQGLKAARGNYACIMHNDVELQGDAISKLEKCMELYPKYVIIGPMTDKTLNPDQSTRAAGERSGEITRTEYLDSFCMMLRTDSNLRLDESYQLAFFEDIDLCFQARGKGHRVGIANSIRLKHYYGTTTFALNLDTDSQQYWKNVAYFNKKWGIEVYSEEELKSKSTFDQLLALDEIVNPIYPEKSLKNYFEELFTDELKTELLRARHDPETLCQLVHLMMVMGEREVMRRLEDRLDNVDLPASLIYQLVRFYYKRNIYSRCLHYLDKLRAEQQSLQSELYRLKIMVDEKDLDQAVPKLTELLDLYPANPELYQVAGDIHQFDGNTEEADSFHTIARQINPFKFDQKEQKASRLLDQDEEFLH